MLLRRYPLELCIGTVHSFECFLVINKSVGYGLQQLEKLEHMLH